MMNQLDKKMRIPYKPGYRATCVLMWIAASISFIVFILNIWVLLQSHQAYYEKIALTDAIIWLILTVGFARCWYVFLVAFIWFFLNQWEGRVYFLLKSENLLQPQYISVLLVLILTILSIITLWLFVVKIHQRIIARLKLHFNETDISKIHKKYKWTNFMLLLFGLSAFITFEIEVFSDLYNTMLYMRSGIIFILLHVWLVKLLSIFSWIVIIVCLTSSNISGWRQLSLPV